MQEDTSISNINGRIRKDCSSVRSESVRRFKPRGVASTGSRSILTEALTPGGAGSARSCGLGPATTGFPPAWTNSSVPSSQLPARRRTARRRGGIRNTDFRHETVGFVDGAQRSGNSGGRDVDGAGGVVGIHVGEGDALDIAIEADAYQLALLVDHRPAGRSGGDVAGADEIHGRDEVEIGLGVVPALRQLVTILIAEGEVEEAAEGGVLKDGGFGAVLVLPGDAE